MKGKKLVNLESKSSSLIFTSFFFLIEGGGSEKVKAFNYAVKAFKKS